MSAKALEAFNKAWGSVDYPPKAVDPLALEAAEQEIGFTLPLPYKAAVLDFGLPRLTFELLDFISDEEADFPDLNEFHGPTEIATSTIDWRELGMPRQLVAIANDCSGNQFAFSTKPSKNEEEIWFWDHDFDTVELVAESFEAWLKLYINLK